MSHTNSTTNYQLPQFVGTDTPGWLTDVNGAMSDIDAAIYARQQAIASVTNDVASLTSRTGALETEAAGLSDEINDPSTGILARLTTDESNISDNATNIGINTTNITALNTTVGAMQAKMPVAYDVTMDDAAWSNDEYSFSDEAVTVNSIITLGIAVGATAAEMDAFQKANLRPVSITAGTGFTVHADGVVPSVDIPVTIVREG